MSVKTEYFHCGTRVVVTGETAELVQNETTRIMDDLENGSATFTMPVKQADGQWMAAGHRITF